MSIQSHADAMNVPIESRPVIRQLDANLVNQIAAGEVIERPAAAIKEIVENAIDAGATRIDVRVRDGGKSFIQVVDNGVGMTPDDMLLAMQRHATSKLPTGDLFNISTLGFRGEALPSIGSVSRLTIQSMPAYEMAVHGAELIIEGGLLLQAPRPVSLSEHGTSMTIKDLFYATPARLKFLKSDATELTACTDCVKRLALAFPHVAFRFKSGDRVVFDYAPRESIGERFSDVLGQSTLDNLRIVNGTRDGITISGVISLPTFHKSQSSDQYFFVNQRPVRDKLLLGVLKAAYQGYLEQGRNPVVALFVTVDPAEVDVNVHPSKTEVRFRDAQGVRALLISCMRATLERHGQESSSHLMGEALMRFKQFDHPRSSASPMMHQSSYTSSSRMGPSASLPQQRAFPYAQQSIPITRSILQSDDVPFMDSGTGTHSVPDDQFPVSYPLGLAKAQVLQTYILAENKDGIVLVDQHAAHERILYEQFKERYLTNQCQRQLLLIPMIVPCTAEQSDYLTLHKESCMRLGFDYDVFGDDVIFRAVPALIAADNIEQMVHDFVTDSTHQTDVLSCTDRLLDILATHACHTSIRAGQTLSIDEMNALLRQIEQTKNSAQCNHGRPTYVQLDQSALERLFGRK